MPERQGLASEQASYYTVPVDKQEWLWAMPRVCAAKVLIVMGMLLCCHPWIWPGFGPKQQATKVSAVLSCLQIHFVSYPSAHSLSSEHRNLMILSVFACTQKAGNPSNYKSLRLHTLKESPA